MAYAWNHIIVLSLPRSENFDAIIKIPLIYRLKDVYAKSCNLLLLCFVHFFVRVVLCFNWPSLTSICLQIEKRKKRHYSM